MYYLAFFIDYHPFFQEKIKSWLKNHKTYTCMSINENKNHHVITINDLLQSREQYYGKPWYAHNEQSWYIHGQHLSQKKLSYFPGLLVTEVGQFSLMSLEKIDTILNWFAINYNWSILPWSNAPRFQSFVFISTEQTLRDRFMDCSPNSFNLSLESMSSTTILSNLLISKYEVPNNFSGVVKAILFEESINTIGEIWESCNCDNHPPYLVTNIDFNQSLLFDNNLLKNTSIKLLNDLKDKYFEEFYKLQIEQKLLFELISSELISKLEILPSSKLAFWISQNTNFEKLGNLLIKTKNKNISYSDLSFFQDSLNVSEWFYGFRRDFCLSSDYNLSLFISRNSQLIQMIDIFRQEKNQEFSGLTEKFCHYDLLACF